MFNFHIKAWHTQTVHVTGFKVENIFVKMLSSEKRAVRIKYLIF